MSTNVNGLAPKLNILKDNVGIHLWDIICVTETHLLAHLPSSIVDIPNYSLIRHDASGHVYKHGVCSYIHNSLMVDSVTQPLPNVLSFRLTSFDVFILIVYRAPSNSSDANESLNSFILDFCSGEEVIVAGDFNLPNIDWSRSNPSCTPLERMFLDTFTAVGLHQWIMEPTFPRSGNVLDLLLTSESDRVGSLNVSAPLPGCDHCLISFDYIFDISPDGTLFSGPSTLSRDWNKGHYHSAARNLNDVDWDVELAYLNANQSFERFSAILHSVTVECIPLKPHRKGRPPWSTRPPASLLNQRHEAWSHYKTVRGRLGRKSTEARSCYSTFASINQRCRAHAVNAQAKYEEDLLRKSHEQPKLFHSYLRHKKVGRPSVGPLQLSSGQLSDDPSCMAEIFAESFSSVYSRSIPSEPSPHQQFHESSLEHIAISREDVLKSLLELDGNSAMGPDDIHPLLLKKCADQLAQPLMTIFNRSLREGTLPDSWKRSLVVPLFKKGVRSDPLNYRPISLTSVPCRAN